MNYDAAYDPRFVFDDVYGALAQQDEPVRDPGRAANEILRRAGRARLGPIPLDVEVIGHDPTPWTFCPPGVQVVGDGGVGLPIYAELHRRFAQAIPAPKLARLDDQASYKDFRDGRRQPYIEDLAKRITALEYALAAHLDDPHAHEVVGALESAVRGGERVPLPLPPQVRGNVECWQDGPEVLCTVRVPGPDGPLFATTGTPVERHMEEVLGHAGQAGIDVIDAALVAPTIAQGPGANDALADICGAASTLISVWKGEPVVASISSSDPQLAAAMALLQRCQRGDRKACVEAYQMMHSRGALIEEAKERLLRGQREMARNRRRP